MHPVLKRDLPVAAASRWGQGKGESCSAAALGFGDYGSILAGNLHGAVGYLYFRLNFPLSYA